MKIKLIVALFLLTIVLLVPAIGLAADVSPGVAGGLIPCGNNVNGVKDACTLCHFVIGFQNLVNFMLKLVITMAFVGIFAAGVMYIISAGDDGMMTNAKKALTASLIGFGVVMGAWLIVNVTIWALGANIGVATGQNWYDFNCSTISSITPNSSPVVTAQNCCVIGAGQCSHVKDASECQSGSYKVGACSTFDICSPSATCKAENKACTINSDCCDGNICTEINDGKVCKKPMCKAKGEQCNPALNAAPQTKCCAPGICKTTGADNSDLSSMCVLP